MSEGSLVILSPSTFVRSSSSAGIPLFAVHPSLAASIPPSGSLLPPPWSVRSVALGIGLHSWSGGRGYGVGKVIFRLRNRYCKESLFAPDMLEMRTRLFKTVSYQARIPPLYALEPTLTYGPP